MGGQPGKPKPLGNPPIRQEPQRPRPIEEPPRPASGPPGGTAAPANAGAKLDLHKNCRECQNGLGEYEWSPLSKSDQAPEFRDRPNWRPFSVRKSRHPSCEE